MRSRMLTINALHGHFEEFWGSLPQRSTNVGQSVSVCEYPGSGLLESVFNLGELLRGRLRLC